ncbi:MAG: hypothetical protein CVV42_17305 [Candidatus Riflebacteria bacterium HGW-Riflebacteria-2]|jgi:GNAT superfamily N-acetyltransferase|nr:MAG: hypothetical protein CVV42_17305 [Candidatus Riflebacteria bacterium HGW-Riflebacteria-2]
MNIVDEFGKGSVFDKEGKSHSFCIKIGYDLGLTYNYQLSQLQFFAPLIEIIESGDLDRDVVEEAMRSLSYEDNHWNWLAKGNKYNDDQHEWFYLLVNNRVEALGFIFFPKNALLEPGEVFYIEYLAVAPWNRDSFFSKKIFRGLGSALVKFLLYYGKTVLSLRLGCSLHSLPKAIPFYEKIGMNRLSSAHDKGILPCFEFCSDRAKAFLRESL